MTRTDNPWRARWVTLVERWQHEAADAGLSDVLGALQMGLRPLAPLAAQVLWVAQPTFALFGEADAITALAELLEDPGAMSEAEGRRDQPLSEGR